MKDCNCNAFAVFEYYFFWNTVLREYPDINCSKYQKKKNVLPKKTNIYRSLRFISLENGVGEWNGAWRFCRTLRSTSTRGTGAISTRPVNASPAEDKNPRRNRFDSRGSVTHESRNYAYREERTPSCAADVIFRTRDLGFLFSFFFLPTRHAFSAIRPVADFSSAPVSRGPNPPV